MKKTIIIAMALLFVFTGMAIAGPQTAKNCGCGVGTLIFKDSNDGLLTQGAASFTNGIFFNQFFGITTGSLECEKSSEIVMKERLNIFVADNMDNVAADIASGRGETLDAIADITDVPVEKRLQLYTALQVNFDNIYPTEGVMSSDVSLKISDIIAEI